VAQVSRSLRPAHRPRGRLGMSRDKVHLRLKRNGTVLPKAASDAVRLYWNTLQTSEKLRILRFEDPQLVSRLCTIWEDLYMLDLACYLHGIKDEESGSNRCGLYMFAIEGSVCLEEANADTIVFKGAPICDAAFLAKPAFVEKIDFFEHLENQLGSPLLHGRPVLKQHEWPLLFTITPNSWQEFVRQILSLVELAVFHAEMEARSVGEPHPSSSLDGPPAGESSSSKRRARKKRTKMAAKHDVHGDPEVCSLCDGTRVLLDDPCPLCMDESESFAQSAENEPELAAVPETSVSLDCEDARPNESCSPRSEMSDVDSAALLQVDKPDKPAILDGSDADMATLPPEDESDASDGSASLDETYHAGKFGCKNENSSTGVHGVADEKKTQAKFCTGTSIPDWSCGWKVASVDDQVHCGHGHHVLFENSEVRSHTPLGSSVHNAAVARTEGLQAVIKNTFVHIQFVDILGECRLSRSVSVPRNFRGF